MDVDFVSELLSDTREIVEMLLEQPLETSQILAREVRAYRDQLLASESPEADLELGLLLAERNLALLQEVESAPEMLRFAQIAACYFVLALDGDDDLASPFGFDDDIEVFNVVAKHLGCEVLCVSL